MTATAPATGSGWSLLPDVADVGPAEIRVARLALLGVVVAYAIVHVFVVGLDRPINWDEAVHLTQVVPGRPAVFMEPHRTRGVSLLVAPVAVFDPGMVALRGYLVVVTAAGMFAAFATWIRLIGVAAPIGAALFSTFWVTVFYSIEVLPNLPVALLAVAIVGLVAPRVVTGAVARWRPLLVATGLLGVMALVRPPDAAALGVGLAAAILVLRPAAVRWSVPVLAGGGLLGLVPWLVEGWVRFGFSPLSTATSAGEYGVGGRRFNQLPLYLSSLEDRLRCAGGCLDDYLAAGGEWLPPARTTTFLVAAVLLVGFTLGAVPATRRPVLLTVVAATPLVLFYGLSGGPMNLRYLLPVFALGAITIALGVTGAWSAWPRTPVGTIARTFLVVGLVVVAVWQVSVGVERLERPATRDRAATLGRALASQLDGEPCVAATRVNYPQIQYWTRCRSLELHRGDDGRLQAPIGEQHSYVDVAAAAAVGDRVFAIAPVDQPDTSPVAGWRELPVEHDLADEYRLLEWRPGDALPEPPCPEDLGGTGRRLAEVLSPRC